MLDLLIRLLIRLKLKRGKSGLMIDHIDLFKAMRKGKR